VKLEKAQKIVESVASEERNFAYGDWDRDEAICVLLLDLQRKLAKVGDEAMRLLSDPLK
jgi:hypothetical protein